MCTVSNMGDAGRKIFDPWIQPTHEPPPYAPPYQIKPEVTRAEYEQLRRDMEALRELLKAAQKVDKAQGLADCEMEEKVTFIKAVAELLGVSLGGRMAGKLIRVLVDGWNRIEPAESLDEVSSAVRFSGLEFVEDGEVIAVIPSSFVVEYGVKGGSQDFQSTKIEFIAPVQFVFVGKDGKELT